MTRPCTRTDLEVCIAFIEAGLWDEARAHLAELSGTPQGIRTLIQARRKADALEALRVALEGMEVNNA